MNWKAIVLPFRGLSFRYIPDKMCYAKQCFRRQSYQLLLMLTFAKYINDIKFQRILPTLKQLSNLFYNNKVSMRCAITIFSCLLQLKIVKCPSCEATKPMASG